MAKGKASGMFASLAVPNYRLFFAGQGLSLIGTWVQRTTMSWFVYRLTNSAFLLGLVSFLSMIPSLFVSPFAGAWADRWNRHRTLLLTQVLFAAQAGLLALGVLSGFIRAERWWPLIVLALMQGLIDAVDSPFRQNFVLDLVRDRKLLPNAIATNSAMFNAARLIGPSIGGAMIVLLGEGVCFLFNSFSYLAVIVALLLIRIPANNARSNPQPILRQVADGWRYAWRNFPIRYLIANLSMFMLFALSYAAVIPVFARDILNGTARTQGLLLSLAGVGALASSLYMANRRTIKGLPLVMVLMGCVGSLALIGFANSRSLPLSMLMMLFIGCGMTIQMSATNTLIQSVVDARFRGRVLSVYTMTFNSLSPFGSLLIGFLTRQIGPRLALTLCAGFCLIWSLSSLQMIPNLIRKIMRMLVRNGNTSIYKPQPVSVEYAGLEA